MQFDGISADWRGIFGASVWSHSETLGYKLLWTAQILHNITILPLSTLSDFCVLNNCSRSENYSRTIQQNCRWSSVFINFILFKYFNIKKPVHVHFLWVYTQGVQSWDFTFLGYSWGNQGFHQGVERGSDFFITSIQITPKIGTPYTQECFQRDHKRSFFTYYSVLPTRQHLQFLCSHICPRFMLSIRLVRFAFTRPHMAAALDSLLASDWSTLDNVNAKLTRRVQRVKSMAKVIAQSV